jgi:hypothetical protein
MDAIRARWAKFDQEHGLESKIRAIRVIRGKTQTAK